jgi:hypothetical protein
MASAEGMTAQDKIYSYLSFNMFFAYLQAELGIGSGNVEGILFIFIENV